MGKTDWDKLKKLQSEEVERRALEDEDNLPAAEDMWKNAQVIMPEQENKASITIRINSRILDYFKKSGPGYQKRINAVLESYVREMESRGGL